MAEKKEIPTLDFCGLIMPISEIDGCSESHWQDVKAVLTEAIEECGLKANIVSNSDEIGIIQKRIIEHLYSYPIVICDVSGKNPNVMLELGLRLAFDKPVIIVKDDRTSYSFDTSPIEHLTYPRDLRFARIVEFQKLLSEKITSTLDKAKTDPGYSPFLKAFGEFSIPKVAQKEVSGQEFIMQQLDSINIALGRLSRNYRPIPPRYAGRNIKNDADICVRGWSSDKIENFMSFLKTLPFVDKISRYEKGEDHLHISIDVMPNTTEKQMEDLRAFSPRLRFSNGANVVS